MKNYFKYIYKIVVVLVVLITTACSTDPCDYDSNNNVSANCLQINRKTNVDRSGMTVSTQYNSNLNAFNGQIMDTRDMSSLPKAEDLNPILTLASKIMKPTNWTPNDLGQVFGIAIDDDENIYLATSGVYNMAGYNFYTNTSPAQVYKCTPPAYTATLLFTLPNTGGGAPNLNDIGNIAYDKVNEQLFTTNLEDGKIYRHDLLGNPLGTAYDPFTADTGIAGIVAQDERIWGVGVNYELGNVKVYFPRVTTGNATREIYSITLNADGSFPANGSEVLEIDNIPGIQMAIMDLAFSNDTNKMLVSERGDAHVAKVLSYDLSGGSWGFNTQYFVGTNAGNDGENSAGGVDFINKSEDGSLICDEFIWASGNFMNARNTVNKIYGIEGIEYSGNNSASTASPNANLDTDYFFDLNGVLGFVDKGNIGDVEVFDANNCFDICP